MKNKNLKVCLFLSIILSVACETTKQNCNGNRTNINTISIEFNDSCQCEIVNANYEDQQLVINSSAQLQQNISCTGQDCTQMNTQFNIDFSKNTLLIGKKMLTAVQGQLISQSVTKECNNNYTYHVKIKNGGFAALGNFNFGVIIPKIAENAVVNFNVEMVN